MTFLFSWSLRPLGKEGLLKAKWGVAAIPWGWGAAARFICDNSDLRANCRNTAAPWWFPISRDLHASQRETGAQRKRPSAGPSLEWIAPSFLRDTSSAPMESSCHIFEGHAYKTCSGVVGCGHLDFRMIGWTIQHFFFLNLLYFCIVEKLWKKAEIIFDYVKFLFPRFCSSVAFIK